MRYSEPLLELHATFQMANPADRERPGRHDDFGAVQPTTILFRLHERGDPRPKIAERSGGEPSAAPAPDFEFSHERDVDPSRDVWVGPGYPGDPPDTLA